MKTFIALVSILFLISCGSNSYIHKYWIPHYGLSDIAEISSQDTVITIERTMCHGGCPVYTLLVLGNGAVIFDGRANVETKGMYRSKVDQEVIDELIRAFETADYFSLNPDNSGLRRIDGCQDVSLHSATVITSLRLGEKFNRIIHNLGDHCIMAQYTLVELEESIDKILNSEQWIEVNTKPWIK